MASTELLNRWNKRDGIGSIEPPLTPNEVDALAKHGIYPETPVRFSRYDDVARAAFIACSHFRIIGNPKLTAETMAVFK